MVALNPGDIAIGSEHGYVEVITSAGVFVQHLDAVDDLLNRMRVNGLTFDEDGNIYYALGPVVQGSRDFIPHDVVYMPDGSGLLTIIARSNNTVILRKHGLVLGQLIQEWSPIQVSSDWTRDRYLKLDIACDSKTVYYTDRGLTIYKYDLETSTQLDPFKTLSATEGFRFNAFKLLYDGEVITSKTNGGNGPRNAICVDSSQTSAWTDEINPPDGTYYIFKRLISDGSDVSSVQVNLTPNPATSNDEVTALACNFFICEALEPETVEMKLTIPRPSLGDETYRSHVYVAG